MFDPTAPGMIYTIQSQRGNFLIKLNAQGSMLGLKSSLSEGHVLDKAQNLYRRGRVPY